MNTANKLIRKNVIAALILLSACLPCFARNLLQNPSFEEGKPKPGICGILTGWNARDVGGVAGLHSISTKKAQDGTRSAQIDIPDGQSAFCYFTPDSIQAQGGKSYRLTFYALYPEAKAGASARAIITRLNAEKKFDGMDGIKTVKITPAPDWTKYTLEYQMPANSSSYCINVRFCLDGSGQIWYDNISFEEIAPPQTIVEFYPGSVNDEKTIYAIRGEACQLLLYAFVDGDRQGIVLRIDAPACFPLLDAAPFYYPNPDKIQIPPFTRHVQGSRIEYDIPLIQPAVLPVSRSAGDLFTGEALLFKTPADMVRSDLSWSLWRGNEKLSSGNLKIQGLTDPAPDAALPGYFTVSSWYSPLLNFLNDADAFSQWLEVMKRSGVSADSVSNSLHPDKQALLKKRGWTNNRTLWFEVPNHCLTGMSNSPQYEKFMKSSLNFSGKFDKKMLAWDFEPALKDDYYHDCPVCRQAFEKNYGKSTAGLKNSEAIEAKFPEQFLQFRSGQLKEIIKKYGQWCKENNCQSGLVIGAVPFEPDETNLLQLKRLCGDIKSYAEYVDYYMPMAYFKPEQFWSSLAAIKAFYPGSVIPVVTSDERHNQTTYPYSLTTPECVRSELLTVAVHGCRQVCLFMGFYVFDGRQILAQRQAMREIAMFEDYLFNGTDAGSLLQLKAQGGMLRGTVKKYKEKSLIALFNLDTAQSRTAVLSLLSGEGEFSLAEPSAKRFFTNKAGSGRLKANDLNNISFTLPPGDVRFFILSAAENDNSANWRPTALEPATPAVVRQWSILDTDSWKCIASGTSGKTAEKITIKNGEAIAEIIPADGAVISKLTDSATRNLVMYKEEGQDGFFRDLFWTPESVRWANDCRLPYQLKKLQVSGNNLEISFEHKLCHPLLAGLIISKDYTFAPGMKSVKNKTTIRNENSSARSITFWSHNRPVLDIKTVEFKISDSETLVPAASNDTNIYIPADRISGCVTVADRKTPRFNIIWPKAILERLYFWTGGSNPTTEGIFRPARLEPGQSWSAEIAVELK
ncbi:MAG: carbohydrate binding domain-containing protein [Victivallaceae bacterium]|jgi:hypothetical protein